MLGDVLKEIREKQGLSQEKLGLNSGVDRTYISEIENNKKSPTVKTLFRICGGLGVKASDVLAKVESERSR